MPRKKDLAHKTENDIFATRLREIMRARGENQTTLAAKTNMQRQTISLYRNGQSKPDTDRLAALAMVLGVSTDWLLGLSDVASPDLDIKAICQKTGLSETAVQNICTLKGPLFQTGLCVFLENAEFIAFCNGFARLSLNVALAKEYEQSTPYQGEDIIFPENDAYRGKFLQGYDVCEYMYQKLIRDFSEAVDSISGLHALRDYVAIKRREGLSTFLDSLSKTTLSPENE